MHCHPLPKEICSPLLETTKIVTTAFILELAISVGVRVSATSVCVLTIGKGEV